MKIVYTILILLTALVVWVFGQELPLLPPHDPTPDYMVPMFFSDGSTGYVDYAATTYSVAGSLSNGPPILLTNKVYVIAAYPKLLTIKIKTKTSLTNEWEYLEQEFLMKLGTNDMEFYTAELTIK